MPLFLLKERMKSTPTLMPDTYPPLKPATTYLNSLYTWSGQLSIIFPFIFLIVSLWFFRLKLRLRIWLTISRTLSYLNDSRPIKILILLLLELIIISIKTFQRTLFGTSVKLFGRLIIDTKPLDTYTLFLPLLVKHFICIFCLLWSKVRFNYYMYLYSIINIFSNRCYFL